MYPHDLYFEIASLRGQDMRNAAAHERLLREAAQIEECAPADPRRDAGYRRLAAAILSLDINTLTGKLRAAHR